MPAHRGPKCRSLMGELAQIGWDQFIVTIVNDIVAIMV